MSTVSDTSTTNDSTPSAGELSAAIRTHHHALAETLDSYTADLEAGASSLESARLAELLDGLTGFLTGELLPHARGEEQTLYPALDPIIREHGSPTATMRVDHEYIGAYVRQIGEAARRLRAAGEQQERERLAQQLARQMIQLQGLFTVHLAKEERVYLPLVEEAISAGDQRALLAALHDEAEGVSSTKEDESEGKAAAKPLDVRALPPAQRHQVIFARFDALPVGGSFELVNDHDPKPLYYQLTAEYAGQLLWQYLEQGPQVWRVRMGKAG
ncbi:MAG TPA: DUF2249 domain-containing protein [Ktedonobacterales bacterium]|nr:DUF2249 domain-containing protein [Ktedonobacterales bacterium]